MRYNFDVAIDRSNTNSIKWNYAKEMVGKDDVLPMWVADMDFEVMDEVKDAISNRAQHGIYGYTNPSSEYYQSIIDWNEKRHQWTIDKSWIRVSIGVVNGIQAAIHGLTQEGDGIVIQTPVYHPFYHIINKSNRVLLKNPLIQKNGNYEMDFDGLESVFKNHPVKLFILCNPHNPVGRVFSREELLRLGQLCIEYGVIVISDEIHSDLIYKPHKHVPFASISEAFQNNCIICTAPSKTFNLAGLSTANMIIPNATLRKQYDAACAKYGITGNNVFGLIACEAAYKYGEAWLEELLVYLEENKQMALSYIHQFLPEVQVQDMEGTYFLWLNCRGILKEYSNEALEHFMLHEARLWFNQGHIFGSDGEGFVRVNIGCTRDTLSEALMRLRQAVENSRK